MKYLLFAGDDWYPFGGWEDFKGQFNTLEEALMYPSLPSYDVREWDSVRGNFAPVN